MNIKLVLRALTVGAVTLCGTVGAQATTWERVRLHFEVSNFGITGYPNIPHEDISGIFDITYNVWGIEPYKINQLSFEGNSLNFNADSSISSVGSLPDWGGTMFIVGGNVDRVSEIGIGTEDYMLVFAIAEGNVKNNFPSYFYYSAQGSYWGSYEINLSVLSYSANASPPNSEPSSPSITLPSPIAGAGLPALLAFGGFVWARRRKAAVPAAA